MPRGFPSQDTGPGMNEMSHDLQVEQEQERATKRELLTAPIAEPLITSKDYHDNGCEDVGEGW